MTGPRIGTSVAALAASLLLVVGCGSSSPTSVTVSSSAGDQTQARLQQGLVSFSDCMRSHGVPNFPDPGAHAFKFELAPSTPHTPAFLTAYSACQHFFPNGGPSGQDVHSPAQIAAFLAFARCVRSHGFPSFPDPTNTGQLTHQMVASAGINLHQPAVKQAGDACVSVSHGFITTADVARFVAGG